MSIWTFFLLNQRLLESFLSRHNCSANSKLGGLGLGGLVFESEYPSVNTNFDTIGLTFVNLLFFFGLAKSHFPHGWMGGLVSSTVQELCDFEESTLLQLEGGFGDGSCQDMVSWLVNLPPCKVPPWEIKPEMKALLREQLWLITGYEGLICHGGTFHGGMLTSHDGTVGWWFRNPADFPADIGFWNHPILLIEF